MLNSRSEMAEERSCEFEDIAIKGIQLKEIKQKGVSKMKRALRPDKQYKVFKYKCNRSPKREER